MAGGNTKKSHLLRALLLVAALGAAAADNPSPQDVNTACAHVTEPKVCEEVIDKAKPATVYDLTVASIKEAMERAGNAHTVVERVVKDSTNPKLKTDLSACASVYQKAKAELEKCIANFKEKGNYNSVVSEIESALTLIDACNDVFSAHPGEVDPVVQATSILKSMISDSLSLSVMIGKDPNANGTAPTYNADGHVTPVSAGAPAGNDPLPESSAGVPRRSLIKLT